MSFACLPNICFKNIWKPLKHNKNVEQEHRKGKDAKEIEHDVKEDMNDLEDELYRHGRRRDH